MCWLGCRSAHSALTRSCRNRTARAVNVGTVRTVKPICRRKRYLQSCSICRCPCDGSLPRLPRKPKKTRCRCRCDLLSTIARIDPNRRPHTRRRSKLWSSPKNETAGRRDNGHRQACRPLCRSAPPAVLRHRRRRLRCRNHWGPANPQPSRGQRPSHRNQHDLSRARVYGPIAQRPMPSRWCCLSKQRSALRPPRLARPPQIGQPHIRLPPCWHSHRRNRPTRSSWVAWQHAPGAPKVRSRSRWPPKVRPHYRKTARAVSLGTCPCRRCSRWQRLVRA